MGSQIDRLSSRYSNLDRQITRWLEIHQDKGADSYRVFIKYCVFFRTLKSLPPLPRQYSAAIGCTKIYQSMGVAVHSHCVGSFEGLLQPYSRGRAAVNCEKHNFSEHPVGSQTNGQVDRSMYGQIDRQIDGRERTKPVDFLSRMVFGDVVYKQEIM